MSTKDRRKGHTHTHTHAHAHTHTHSHTCMHAHRHACTHTHTHTLIYAPPPPPPFSYLQCQWHCRQSWTPSLSATPCYSQSAPQRVHNGRSPGKPHTGWSHRATVSGSREQPVPWGCWWKDLHPVNEINTFHIKNKESKWSSSSV